VALGIAGLKVRARHGAEAELASVNRRSAALAAGLRDTEQRATIAEQRSAELKQKVEAARAQAAADAEAAKVAAEWDPIKEGKAFTQRHPEILQALINWEESLADWNHPKLYKALGFTSAQIAEFRKLQRQLSSGERVTLPGIPTMLVRPYDNALPSSEVYRQLRDLVGVEKRKIYEDVMANDRRSARFITYHMIGALCFTDTPISPQQAEQIIQAFGGRPAAPAYFDLAAVDSKVRGVISAAQVPAWEAEMAEQQIQRAIVAQRKPPPPRPATTK
jgi:hypothetical protein